VDWLSALLTCNNFGMELLTPSSETEDELLREKLDKFDDIPKTLHVGVTSMGTTDEWYSINTGKVFDFDFEWSRSSDSYSADSNCLKMRKHYDKFSYNVASCINSLSYFICQKVIDDGAEEAQTIASTSPASWILSSTTTIPDGYENATDANVLV